MIKLSKTSKLDGILSWSLQALETCQGSVNGDGTLVDACKGCYATTGNYNYNMVNHVTPIYSAYAVTGYRANGFDVYTGIKPTVLSGSIHFTVPTSVNADGVMQYENVSSRIQNRVVSFVGSSYTYNYRAHALSVTAMAGQDGLYQGGVFYKLGF